MVVFVCAGAYALDIRNWKWTFRFPTPFDPVFPYTVGYLTGAISILHKPLLHRIYCGSHVRAEQNHISPKKEGWSTCPNV